MLVEPYKSELVALWRFKNPTIAKLSAAALLEKFNGFLHEADFAGMDMTRKFLQMGYTRSRRYANHRSGKKYGSYGRSILPADKDPVKARSAAIFYQAWQKVEAVRVYQNMRAEWKLWYG